MESNRLKRLFVAFFAFRIFFASLPSVNAAIQNSLNTKEGSPLSYSAKAHCYFHFSLGHILELKGKYREAVKEYSQALKVDAMQPDIHIAIASALYYGGDDQKAIEHCQKAIALEQNNPTAHRLLGNVYFNFFIKSNFAPQYASLAIEELEKVVSLEKDDEHSYLTLGKLYHYKEEYQQSLDYLFQHLQYNSGSKAGLLFIARNYINLGKFSEALKYLTKLREINPSDLNVLSLMAGIYKYLKDYEKLIDLYKKSLKLKPDDFEMRNQLGLAYFEDAQLLNAEAEFKNVLQLQPDDLFALNYLALIYLNLKRYAAAENLYLKLLQRHPEDITARYNLAKVYGERRDYEKAIETYDELLREIKKGNKDIKKEDLAVILGNKGWLNYQRGEFNQAVEDFRRSEEISPQMAANFLPALIVSLHQAGQSDQALKRCDEAIAQKPEELTFYLIKSEILAEKEQKEKGLKLLRGLIEQGKSSPRLYLSIANIYLEAKEYSKAQEVLSEALIYFSQNEDLIFTLGASYERMGRHDLAEETFKRIIKKNPNHDRALNYLGYMLAEKGIRLQEAIGYIKRALELDSTNGSYLDSLGWAYYQLNKLDEAKKYLEIAVKKNPKSAEIHHHLGDLYHRLGQLSEAIREWEKALTLKPENEEKIREKIKETEKKQIKER